MFVAIKKKLKVFCVVSAWNILVLHATVYISTKRFWIVDDNLEEVFPCFTQALDRTLEFKLNTVCDIKPWCCGLFSLVSFLPSLVSFQMWMLDLVGFKQLLQLQQLCSFTLRIDMFLGLICSTGCQKCFLFPFWTRITSQLTTVQFELFGDQYEPVSNQ